MANKNKNIKKKNKMIEKWIEEKQLYTYIKFCLKDGVENSRLTFILLKLRLVVDNNIYLIIRILI